MRTLPFALLALPLFAACASPYARCVEEYSGDYLRLNAQIATTQGNIDRGYAIHTQSVPETVWEQCPRFKDGKIIGYRLCPETHYREIETPVVISVPSERDRLKRLTRDRAALQQRHDSVIEQCRMAHPPK
ncbi:MAG: hypothetical protein MJH10_20750 [Epibacterium sp.]|nr:hypothetical protein [Epibacterium sp.]NQX75894.1 hypothetical protein [Epibacterium sp.]